MAISLKEITWKNIKAVLQAYPRKWSINFFQKNLEYINEQVEWRIDRVAEKSPQCLIKGECKICHCKIPDLFYADKACSNVEDPCYGELMSKREWTQFKNKTNYVS